MKRAPRVLLIGAAGRMGRAIVAAAAGEDILLAAECGRDGDIEAGIGGCDVVVDFSAPVVTQAVCAAAAANGKPLVIGTTGHTAEQRQTIERTARAVPIVLAANFSLGVNTLFSLVRRAAELLGDDADVEIIETHHRLKKDAPSGTAKRLAEIVAEVRGLDPARAVSHGRAGIVGERPREQIGMHAIRAGDVVGEHTVLFASAGERLELTHRAASRETFAVGALRAARWLVGRPPALYSMQDVLQSSPTAP